MNRTIIDLPPNFGPLVSDWMIDVRGRSAGETVDGGGQVIYGNQPRWTASLDLSGFGRDRVMIWRAIRARMRGRINILRVHGCAIDRYRPRLIVDPVYHSDGSPFSDGTGYAFTPTVVPTTLRSAGDDTFTTNANLISDQLQPGHTVSYDDWPYQIVGIEGDVQERTYYIEPPFRREIPIGAEIRIGDATALMAFVDDTQGRMPLQYGKNGDTQIDLVEWTNRP